MLGEQPLTAAVVALFVVQLLVFLAVARYGRRAVAVDGGTAVEDSESYIEEDAVECPHCGEVNEHGYRFCRRCVSELPGPASFESASGRPFSRGTL